MITSRMTPAMIHPRTRKPRRRRGTVGTRIGCEAYCRGTDVPGRAIRRSLGAARFVGDGEQAPTTGVRGRELLTGREALPAPCGLERVVVRVGALTLLGRDPPKPSALWRGVVHPARVHGRERGGAGGGHRVGFGPRLDEDSGARHVRGAAGAGPDVVLRAR